MKRSTQYLMVGCGSGCLLVILAIVAVVGGSAFLVKDTMEGFDGAIESRAELEAEHGEVKDFTPWGDGAVPPERMEAFLAVRDATTPARTQLVDAMKKIPMDPEKAKEIDEKPFFEKMRAVFDITSSSMGMAGEMGHLFGARNRALLEHQMGLGEYTYIFVLSYGLDTVPAVGAGRPPTPPRVARRGESVHHGRKRRRP